MLWHIGVNGIFHSKPPELLDSIQRGGNNANRRIAPDSYKKSFANIQPSGLPTTNWAPRRLKQARSTKNKNVL